MSLPTSEEQPEMECSAQKHETLLTFYRTSWNEMTWRRNAGYRTIILGFGYFGLMLILAGYTQHVGIPRAILSAVLAIGTLFGAGYLASNYKKYMAAAKMTVRIEEYLGAYASNFLGRLGALMPPQRKERPELPLTSDPVSFFSIIAFAIGGLLTAIAMLTS